MAQLLKFECDVTDGERVWVERFEKDFPSLDHARGWSEFAILIFNSSRNENEKERHLLNVREATGSLIDRAEKV